MAGVRRARAAVRLIRLNVDSVPETETRLLFVLAGLPQPVGNVRVMSSSGDFIALPDLCWLCSRTAVEYDGRHHVVDHRQWRHDLGRRERYDDEGWRVLVAHAADRRHPGQLLRRVHRILLERGQPGVPAELSPEWRLHFPRRPGPTVLPRDRMAA